MKKMTKLSHVGRFLCGMLLLKVLEAMPSTGVTYSSKSPFSSKREFSAISPVMLRRMA